MSFAEKKLFVLCFEILMAIRSTDECHYSLKHIIILYVSPIGINLLAVQALIMCDSI